MMTDLHKDIEIETHPWPPFIPDGAKVLIMGTFPPQPKRWAMNFYYPNRTNDFWFMMGLIFYGNRQALYSTDKKTFNLDAIKQLLADKGIALNDTGHKIRRLMNNASDKFLEILEPVNLKQLLDRMPHCATIATTGEKAAGVIATLTGTEPPKMGQMVKSNDGLEIWRMPSTSRAYPLSLEKKAAFYATMFQHAGIETLYEPQK
ncbi:MAG: uracil-DNA glycosylase family protein [Firmicutes bacterium]|nr:uracil-DNA glycosylase family protein [Bacillota bacterium]MCM1401546.1 uracil-DNA glycosylase family protein [Bacteroides sp.]MCM1476592.1 uracil-DNA glycosylase family protein [Bacteroides sp.]